MRTATLQDREPRWDRPRCRRPGIACGTRPSACWRVAPKRSSRALSQDSAAFLAANRQEGGQ